MRKISAILAIALLTVSLAIAETIEHDSGLTVTYPDNWAVEVDPEDDDNMVMKAPSGDQVVYFAVEDGTDAKASASSVLPDVKEIVKDAKIMEKKATTVNGMSAYQVTGYGAYPQDYWIALYVEYDGKIFQMLGIGSESGWGWESGDCEVATLLYGIKPKN